MNTTATRFTRMAVLFGSVSFLSSFLLFWIEPLVGKQLLPLVGGAPAVWTVCLLFFQCALLAGYVVAHGITKVPDTRAQAAIYLLIAAASFVILPIHFNTTPTDPSHPVAWLFIELCRTLLLPFVSVAATAPLLQYWYSKSRGVRSEDPYFLYAASNAGSLLALLSFPVLLEPNLRVHSQNGAWSIVFVLAAIACAATTLTIRRDNAGPAASPNKKTDVSPPKPALRSVLTWMLLAAVPSSLVMGVTSFLTSDLAPVPLLWVVPLAIYLATYIAAFGWLRARLPEWFAGVLVALAIMWCAVYRTHVDISLALLVLLHLILFAALALAAHVKLASARPAASHLTMFYIAIAVGGVLGGSFNTLLAPVVFNSFSEYPLVVLLALLIALHPFQRLDVKRDVLPVAAVVVIIIATILFKRTTRLVDGVLIVGVPSAIALVISSRRIAFVVALTAILISARFDPWVSGPTIRAERNFYGVLRLTTDAAGRYHELTHGSTLHGASDTEAPGGSQPLTYYSILSPVADALHAAQSRAPSLNVGVVGLGVGSLAWYARPGENWTFYEINPAVERFARDTTAFPFLQRSHAASIRVVLGDARIELNKAPASTYDVLVLDAFTSDAIPLHLLTKEAMSLYMSRLRPGGFLIYHVSNHYLHFSPPLAAVAQSLGFHAYLCQMQVTWDQYLARLQASDWVVVARDSKDFPLALSPQWMELDGSGLRPWTDDYSNIWTALAH